MVDVLYGIPDNAEGRIGEKRAPEQASAGALLVQERNSVAKIAYGKPIPFANVPLVRFKAFCRLVTETLKTSISYYYNDNHTTATPPLIPSIT